MRITFVVAANLACFEMFVETMAVVKEADYYSRPSGFRMLPRDTDGVKEDFYVQLRGEYAGFSTQRKCGYTVTKDAVIYIGSAGNMCWVRRLTEDTVEVGYWGARHGINLRRLLDNDQYDQLCDMVPAVYETQEPDWKWFDTLDEHPENPNHRSHFPEEAA